MDSVVHFEIPMDDAARAKKFYADAFGWELTDAPEFNYVMAVTSPMDEKHMPTAPGTINGGLAKRGVVAAPSFAINVKSIEESQAKLLATGGTLVKEKAPVGTMGFIAYFKDTEGNVLSLWQNAG